MVLKKAYIRDLLNSSIINFIFKFCNFKNDGKILVKSMDGIGDILVRSKLAEKIMEKYGEDNVYFLMKEHYKSLGEMLGYNVIGIPRKSEKNLFKRLKMMYQINKKYSPKKFLNIEFGNDSIVANICASEKIGRKDNYPTVQRYNKYYTKTFEFSKENKKVLENIRDIAKNILNEKIELEDIIPDLSKKFSKKEEGIVIAVGSTARDRVCSPKRMKEYILELNKFYPNEEIILVGNGELQKNYAQYLIQELSQLKIKNFIDKTTLKEAFQLVAGSKLFLGFESGLYNFCFVTRKKGIALFKDINAPFAHEVPWLKIVGPENEKIDNFYDENYSDEKINNISVKKFREAIEELR